MNGPTRPRPASGWARGVLAAGLLWAPLAWGGDADGPPVSFRQDLQPILTGRCVACHVTGAENAGLNLARSVARRNLVGAASTESPLMRVAPGDPEASYLLHKLRGTQGSVGGSGALMPLADSPKAQPLDAQQIDLFRRWILEGAADN